MINGGKGLAIDKDGITILVHGALPGETVTLKNSDKKRNHKTADVQAVVSANTQRIVPPCRWYDGCGGCDLMHCNYPYQLVLKKEIIEDLYCREFGSEALSQCPVNPVLPSSKQFNYRQRIRLLVSENEEVGYRQAGSHRVIPIDTCMIAHEHINESFAAIRDAQAFDHLISLSEEIELQWNPLSTGVTLIFHFHRKPRPTDIKQAKALLDAYEQLEHILLVGDSFQPGVISKHNDTAKPRLGMQVAVDGHHELEIEWEAGGFCQVNTEQNLNMIETVLDLAALQTDETVLDLYCGMGNFSLPLSFFAKAVEGMEGQGASIRCARMNSEQNGITNTLFTKTDIHKGCSALLKGQRSFDCVIVDPPRAGIPDLYEQLAQLTKKRLVYVSCDPATLFRDLFHLVKRGFIIRKIQPVDMFPQTHHIETVVLLEKN